MVPLARLYELLLEHADQEADKLRLLGKLVEVTGKRLNDRKAAAEYARRAYELAPENLAVLDLLEESTRAAGTWTPSSKRSSEGWRRATSRRRPLWWLPKVPAPVPAKKGKKKRRRDAARSRPGASRRRPSGKQRAPVARTALARVLAEELNRSEQAAATYKQMLERNPADAEVAAALEAILRREDRRDDLRWLLELRVEHAAGDDARARILSDWATLEEDVFEAPDQAIALYRRVLQIHASDPAALGALPRLLLAKGDAAGAVEIVEQHRAMLSGDERAERSVELAEYYQNLCRGPRRRSKTPFWPLIFRR